MFHIIIIIIILLLMVSEVRIIYVRAGDFLGGIFGDSTMETIICFPKKYFTGMVQHW